MVVQRSAGIISRKTTTSSSSSTTCIWGQVNKFIIIIIRRNSGSGSSARYHQRIGHSIISTKDIQQRQEQQQYQPKTLFIQRTETYNQYTNFSSIVNCYYFPTFQELNTKINNLSVSSQELSKYTSLFTANVRKEFQRALSTKVSGSDVNNTIMEEEADQTSTRNLCVAGESQQRGSSRNNKEHNEKGKIISNTTTSSTTTASMTTMEKQEKSLVVLQDDNPCWGSPQHCDLSTLLSKIDKDNAILFESPYYIILNKPPDLRMDGPYPATVHKLLTYWYPAPSLLESIVTDNATAATTTTTTIETGITSKDTTLMDAVSRLHRHNDLADNSLRPCHQLDYATSGVLCIARTQQAAASATTQWEDRKVHKSYLAIVQGNITAHRRHDDDNDSQKREEEGDNGKTNSLPVLSKLDMEHRLQSLESTYRRSRQKRRPDTFAGFQPPHSIFYKWKSIQPTITSTTTRTDNSPSASDNGSNNKKKKKKRQRNNALLSSDQWEQVWVPVETALKELDKESNTKAQECVNTDTDNDIIIPPTEEDEGASASSVMKHTLLQQDWKHISKSSDLIQFKYAFQQASEIHNNIIRMLMEEEQRESKQAMELPTIFQIENEPNSIYIYCPLAQASDSFQMKIPSNVAKDYPHLSFLAPNDDEKEKDDDDDQKNTMDATTPTATAATTTNRIKKKKKNNLDFKPSLTKCTILHGTGRDDDGDGNQSYIGLKYQPESKNQQEADLSSSTSSSTLPSLAQPVTKVQLWPLTGRRHQLRVHMALLGHAILGDVSYATTTTNNGNSNTNISRRNQKYSNDKQIDEHVNMHDNGMMKDNNNGDGDGKSTEQENDHLHLPPRMCLHSHTLSLQLMIGEEEGQGQGHQQQPKNDNNGSPWRIISPDPFPVSEQGFVQISSI